MVMVRRGPTPEEQGRLFEVETHFVGTDPETADRELRFRMPEPEEISEEFADTTREIPE